MQKRICLDLWRTEIRSKYKMFTYDEAEGFKEVFSKDIVNYGNVRGLYIGETFLSCSRKYSRIILR